MSEHWTAENTRTGFHRQRRGLMGTGLVLGLYVISEVKLEKVNVLGNEFGIGNPQIVPVLLGLAWLYFLARYWQYMIVVNDPRPSQFRTEIRKNLIVSRARATFDPSEAFDKLGIAPAERLSHTTTLRQIDQYPGEPRWQVLLDGTLKFHAGGSVVTRVFHQERMELMLSQRDELYVQLWSAANAPYFSEYGLPIFVGLFPLYVWVGHLLASLASVAAGYAVTA